MENIEKELIESNARKFSTRQVSRTDLSRQAGATLDNKGLGLEQEIQNAIA